MKVVLRRGKNAFCRYFPSLLLITLVAFGIIYSGVFLLIAFLVVVFEFVWTMVFHKKALEIETPTPNASNQPYHPSVVFFEKPWNGWRYWMAFTPMPLGAKPYPDRWENPCVISSNDGINWTYPDGLVRPIADLTEDEIAMNAYYSDPDMIYCDDASKLRIYYRKNSRVGAKDISLYFQESFDGKKWGGQRPVTLGPDIVKQRPVSPSFVYKKDEVKMWFVTEGGDTHNIYYSSSPDGFSFYTSSLCRLCGKNCNPWHIDVQCDSNKFIMTIYELSNRISVWQSFNGMEFTFIKDVIFPSKILGTFNNAGLYRACMIKTEECYRVFFSARNRRKTNIGIAEGNSIAEIQTINGTKQVKFGDFILDFLSKYTQVFRGFLRIVNYVKHKMTR